MHIRPGNTLIPAVIVILAISAFVGILAFSVWPTDKEFTVTPPFVRTRVHSNVNANVNGNGNTNTVVANENANANSSADLTAGWKTYTNTKYEYSIKYPQDWKISTMGESVTFYGEATGGPFTAPSVTVTTKNALDPKSTCLLEETKVIVLDEERTRQKQGCGYAGSVFATYIEYGDGYIVVSWSEDVNASYPTYEAILSTFSFTDPTAGWKTYTNSSLGYSVKYPPTWKTSTCPDVNSVWFGTTNIHCQSEGSGGNFSLDLLSNDFNLARSLTQTKSEMVDPAQTTIIVGGQDGTRLVGTLRKDQNFMGGGGWFKDDVYFLHDGRYYHLGYFTIDGTTTLDTTFLNLISTFAFTQPHL